jgi:hypothetical protein
MTAGDMLFSEKLMVVVSQSYDTVFLSRFAASGRGYAQDTGYEGLPGMRPAIGVCGGIGPD